MPKKYHSNLDLDAADEWNFLLDSSADTRGDANGIALSRVGVATDDVRQASVDLAGALSKVDGDAAVLTMSPPSSLLTPPLEAGGALTFVLHDIGGVTPGSQAEAGFQRAAALWQSYLGDAVTIRVDVGFSDLGTSILGSTGSTDAVVSYSSVRNALTADRTSADDTTAVASLSTGTSLSFFTNNSAGTRVFDSNGSGNNAFLDVSTADLKALGITVDANGQPIDTGGADAHITFNSRFSWDFDPSNGINAGAIDFVGVAFHEIGHALGFDSGVDTVDYYSGFGPGAPLDLNPYAVFSVLDLFRYSASGRDLSYGGSTYFSINGGATNLALFSTGTYNGDGWQASHWKDNLGIGIMDPTSVPAGQANVITSRDIQAMDVIGWNLISATPHPPMITSNGGGDTASMTDREDRTTVTTVTATDPDAGTVLTYSIIGGADASKFQINGSSGALTFITAPNYENPTDSDHNNSYVVQVRVSDGALTDSQTLTVNVVDIREDRPQPPDFNSDFQSDFLWRNDNGRLDSWEMNLGGYGGGQTFGIQPAQWHVVGFGDFNGDGTTDMLWRADDGHVATWQLRNGAYGGGVDLGGQPLQWHILGLGDFNGDGTTDILWQHDSGELDTWQMKNGAYGGGKAFGIQPPQWHVIGFGDFNGDGTTDLLWQASNGQLDTWEMKNGAYAGGKTFGIQPKDWHPIGFGDFNGDGTTDMLWRNDNGSVATWEMHNGAYGGGVNLGPLPNSWHFQKIGDFNGDGTSDILWRNDNGQLDTWEMKNGNYGGGQHLGVMPSDWHIQ